jgi:beta-glucosidase
MEKVEHIIEKMTLEEKAAFCSGADFWHLKGLERLGIPEIMITDGPHGLRKAVDDGDQASLGQNLPATCFPTASALAATWNRELIQRVGEALGEECLEAKVSVILGPGANIKRSPLCGRNFEYYSEDPYLTGEMAASFIQGVQRKGVGTSLKHYAVNNQEQRRMVIDAVVDERALREIYLAGFEAAVKAAQPWTVMCAYNQVNGVFCAESVYLNQEILREEWGFEGLVVTDWGASNRRVAGLRAGIDLEMPGVRNGNTARIVAAVEEGRLDEAILDRTVARILTLIRKAAETLAQDQTYDRQAHHALARQVAAEGIVLLKNDGGILPLTKDTRVALIGGFAKVPRYQGAGSSYMNPTRLDNIHDEIVELVGEDTIAYAPGYPTDGESIDEALIQEAIKSAQGAEVVVICAGLTDRYEVEGLDRPHMKLPQAHDALIEAIGGAHPQVVVVLNNGAPVEMPWVERVSAVVEGYLGGQAGAGAVADILYGRVCPSGKLAETFPLKLEDNPSYHYFPGGPTSVEYRESLYVGYRYYDTVQSQVLFPFGHGLSYTTFEYRDLALSQPVISESETLTVSLQVANTGPLAGKETVQLYVRDLESTAFRPDRELKAFKKVSLEPGEVKTVTLTLDRRAFAYYHTDLNDWHVESGTFEILVGASSRDIRLTATVQVESAQDPVPAPDMVGLAQHYDFPKGTPISLESFERLLGRKVPGPGVAGQKPYTLNTPIADMLDSNPGRLLGRVMDWKIKDMFKHDPDNPNALMVGASAWESPIRSITMGGFTFEMLDGLLLMLNGKVIRGLVALLRGLWNKRKMP